MKRRKHSWRMAVLLITCLILVEWFGRCALDKNFKAKEHLLSLLWQCSPPRKQCEHLIQHIVEDDSQTPNSKSLLENSDILSFLSPKSTNSPLLFDRDPDHSISSAMPPLSLRTSLQIIVSPDVPKFSPTHIQSASSSFSGSLFSSSPVHWHPGNNQSPFSHVEATLRSFRSPEPPSPLPEPSKLRETSPFTSPVPSHAHSPSDRLSVPAASSKLPLPAILPPVPSLNQPTTSAGQPPQHFQPPTTSVPKMAQERHHHIPSFSPAPAPIASSPNAHKSNGGPFRHWHGHSKYPPDCATVLCAAPYTQTTLGSPCGCVLPIQVRLELSVALYALFPSISVLADEIANGTLLLQSQVRVTGAAADSEDQGKSIAEVNLVPLDQAFDKLTATLIFQRFWNQEVPISESVFGPYTVMYVRYPGLPPSPPSATPHSTTGGLSGTQAGPVEQPLSVDVNKKDEKIDSATIGVITLSSTIASVVGLAVFWALFLKCIRCKAPIPETTLSITTSVPKGSGGVSRLLRDTGISPPASLNASMVHLSGSMRMFPLSELERATNKFSMHNVVGEGGFGRVFFGNLEDGRKVAVKVLTRKDHQGIKEFNAEVETLSRLHHRNLIMLIGICREENSRCLVYELIPNGSVESHLHGIDKLSAPLDWDARMKIALGAARGLAYLHEDSNPRVIHRDFKASNILLENDFSPKISDFGLATAVSDEENQHISTRVMGTFGYVAPEYAMTGNLLSKSDVYSYGVVLLELLSGRKPVDTSQPPGQENLVTWACPLLSSREGLEMLVDPALQDTVPFNNLTKVAAIASMCVQPEVSQRPFMGEVVQALKLVCNDLDASNETCSVTLSPQNSGCRNDHSWVGDRTTQTGDSTYSISEDYDSGSIRETDSETERPFSITTLLSQSGDFVKELSDSFRRHSTSDLLSPIETNLGWNRDGYSVDGSMSEHALRRLSNVRFSKESKGTWQ